MACDVIFSYDPSILACEETGRRDPTSSQLDDEVEGSPAVFITNVIPPSPKEGQHKLSFNAHGIPGTANATPQTPITSSTTPTTPSINSFLAQLLPTCRSSLHTIWRILE